jgi:hypothetical protein
MKTRRRIQIVLANVLISSTQLFGAAPAAGPLPDHFGVFAVAKGELVELTKLVAGTDFSPMGGLAKFSSIPNQNMPSDVLFIAYGGGDNPELVRASETSPGSFEVKWQEQVTLQISPVKGEEEMYRLKPAEPLEAGLYVLIVVACQENRWNFSCYYPMVVGSPLQAARPQLAAPLAFDPGYEISGRKITFTFDPAAYNLKRAVQSVTIAGSFNNWSTNSSRWLASDNDHDGRWTLVADRGDVICGSQFKFVVDGNGWQQPKSTWPAKNLADDGHGGFNLVVLCN